jgi:hypothetical protein
MRVHRVVHQEPLADALKLPAPPNRIEATPAQQITERRHDNESKGQELVATSEKFPELSVISARRLPGILLSGGVEGVAPTPARYRGRHGELLARRH